LVSGAAHTATKVLTDAPKVGPDARLVEHVVGEQAPRRVLRGREGGARVGPQRVLGVGGQALPQSAPHICILAACRPKPHTSDTWPSGAPPGSASWLGGGAWRWRGRRRALRSQSCSSWCERTIEYLQKCGRTPIGHFQHGLRGGVELQLRRALHRDGGRRGAGASQRRRHGQVDDAVHL